MIQLNSIINDNNSKIQPRSIVMPESKPSSGKVKKFIAFMVTAIIIFAVIIVMNVGGIRNKLNISQLLARETVENDIQQMIYAQKKQIDEEKSSLLSLKAELTVKEDELNQKMQQLEQAQQEVDGLKQRLQEQVSDIKRLSNLYEKMEPSSAAKIMLNYPDKAIIVNVIKNMSSTKAAEILSEMDAASAAQLLQKLAQ